jgi:hypothetical protein
MNMRFVYVAVIVAAAALISAPAGAGNHVAAPAAAAKVKPTTAPAPVAKPAAPAGMPAKVSQSQADACYPDAMRLCGAPKVWDSVGFAEHTRIIGCMMGKSNDVSDKCKKAFGR